MKKVGCNMMVLGRYRIKVTGFEPMTLCTHNRCADAPHPFEKRNSVRYSISPASHRTTDGGLLAECANAPINH